MDTEAFIVEETTKEWVVLDGTARNPRFKTLGGAVMWCLENQLPLYRPFPQNRGHARS
jgi:hypothetical protein